MQLRQLALLFIFKLSFLIHFLSFKLLDRLMSSLFDVVKVVNRQCCR